MKCCRLLEKKVTLDQVMRFYSGVNGSKVCTLRYLTALLGQRDVSLLAVLSAFWYLKKCASLHVVQRH